MTSLVCFVTIKLYGGTTAAGENKRELTPEYIHNLRIRFHPLVLRQQITLESYVSKAEDLACLFINLVLRVTPKPHVVEPRRSARACSSEPGTRGFD